MSQKSWIKFSSCCFLVAVDVARTTRHELKQPADYRVGLGVSGHILLGEYRGDRRLCVYEVSAGRFTERWSGDCPSDISSSCYKAVTSSGQAVLQEDTDSDTVMLGSQGQVVTRRRTEGELLCCLPPDRRVYRQRDEEEEERYRLVIVEGETNHPLQRRGGWGVDLSVCAAENRIAVVDWREKTLTVFTDYVGKSHHDTPSRKHKIFLQK